MEEKQLILLAHNSCQIQGKMFEGIHFLPVLKRIVESLQGKPEEYHLPKDKSWKVVQVSFQ